MSGPPQMETGGDLSSATRQQLEVAARGLGLRADEELSDRELIQAILRRRALLAELEPEALRDILRWAGWSADSTLTREHMARQIARIEKMRFEGLTHRGLVAYARLKGLPAAADQSAEVIIDRIRRAETLGQFLRRKRRALVGSIISRLVSKASEAAAWTDGVDTAPGSAGQTPPDLRHEIEQQGVVGGLARRLRGAADDYVREKLDEIERRIDRKLDEIDRRLAEWRDREVATRLRIIKITLAVTVIVALCSLGYSYLKLHYLRSEGPAEATPARSAPVEARPMGPDGPSP